MVFIVSLEHHGGSSSRSTDDQVSAGVDRARVSISPGGEGSDDDERTHTTTAGELHRNFTIFLLDARHDRGYMDVRRNHEIDDSDR